MKKETTILLLVLSAFICLAVACGNDVSPPHHEHSFSKDWVSNDEEHWHAATCGHNLKEDVSSNSFKWVSGSFTGTCTQTGEAERECTECGRKVTESVIGSHSFNESGICSICNTVFPNVGFPNKKPKGLQPPAVRIVYLPSIVGDWMVFQKGCNGKFRCSPPCIQLGEGIIHTVTNGPAVQNAPRRTDASNATDSTF